MELTPTPQEIGQKTTVDGWDAVICDKTVSDKGNVYVAFSVYSIPAMYIENHWYRVTEFGYRKA